MDVVTHPTGDDPRAAGLARGRSRRLLTERPPEVDEVVLVVDFDGVRGLVEDAEERDAYRELMSMGLRVEANENCFTLRNLSLERVLDGVEIVENSTAELARLQGEGAAYIKVP